MTHHSFAEPSAPSILRLTLIPKILPHRRYLILCLFPAVQTFINRDCWEALGGRRDLSPASRTGFPARADKAAALPTFCPIGPDSLASVVPSSHGQVMEAVHTLHMLK